MFGAGKSWKSSQHSPEGWEKAGAGLKAEAPGKGNSEGWRERAWQGSEGSGGHRQPGAELAAGGKGRSLGSGGKSEARSAQEWGLRPEPQPWVGIATSQGTGAQRQTLPLPPDRVPDSCQCRKALKRETKNTLPSQKERNSKFNNLM